MPFDAELAAIQAVLKWFRNCGSATHDDPLGLSKCHRPGRSYWPRPRARVARRIHDIVYRLPSNRTLEIRWIKGHSGSPRNDKADSIAGAAAEKPSYRETSLAPLKTRISERYNTCKKKWNDNRAHYGSEYISPPPKKSCLDRARNGLARAASHIRCVPPWHKKASQRPLLVLRFQQLDDEVTPLASLPQPKTFLR